MSSQLLELGLLSVVGDASAGVDVVVLTEVVGGASVVVVVGQSAVLHTPVSSRSGHSNPPNPDGSRISLLLDFVPPPQVALQTFHSDQASTSQSTGDPPVS